MKRLILLLLVLCLVFTVACSRGNVLTGTTVIDLDKLDKAEDKVDPKEDKEEDKVTENGVPQVDEEVKGTCSEDSMGAVRVIDEDGQKKS